MKFRNGLLLALSVSLLAGTGTTALAKTMQDITYHWAKQDIQDLNGKNLLVGYQSGKFQPYRYATRAEFTNLLSRAMTVMGSETEPFADLKAGYWANPAIGGAHEQKLVVGYPNSDKFSPQQPITRLEALMALANATVGDDLPEDRVNLILRSYRDGNRVPQWARQAVAKTSYYDVFKSVTNSYNSIRPNDRLTRGEMAHLVNQLLEHNELALAPSIELAHTWPSGRVSADGKTAEAVTKTTYRPAVATVTAPLFSEDSKVGDKVTFVLKEAAVTPDGIKAPAGSKVLGWITEIKPATTTTVGTATFEFDTLTTPADKTYKINGVADLTGARLKSGLAPSHAKTLTGKDLERQSTSAALLRPGDRVNIRFTD